MTSPPGFSATVKGKRRSIHGPWRASILNNVEMGGARFVRCNSEGASLDNTFYSNTVFEQCIGLDLELMAGFACFAFGRKLYDEWSIVTL